MKNILIIGAHYDDTELGCGGTAAKLVKDGMKVYKLTLTNNETDFKQMNISVSAESSAIQSKKACEVLGIEEITEFIPVKCNELTYNKIDMQRIEKIIYDYNIDTVFIHFQEDMNQDHIAASQLCRTAARHCENVFAYQSNGYVLNESYYPNYFFDITDFIDKKIEALNQYGSEHNRFSKLFETNIKRNEVWGFANKVDYAEGFVLYKYLNK